MRMHEKPLYFTRVLSFANSALGGHQTELNESLPHVRREGRFEKGCQKSGFRPRNSEVLTNGENFNYEVSPYNPSLLHY